MHRCYSVTITVYPITLVHNRVMLKYYVTSLYQPTYQGCTNYRYLSIIVSMSEKRSDFADFTFEYISILLNFKQNYRIPVSDGFQ